MTEPHRKSSDHFEESAFHDGRLMRIGLLIAGVYLFLGVMPLMRWGAVNHNWVPLGLHVLALSLAIVFWLGDLPTKVRPVRDWLGLALIAFMYFDLRYIGGGIGLSRKDERIAALDRKLFHGDLWTDLAQRFRTLPFSELVHLCYLSYYPLIAVPPFLLWRKHRRHEFTITILTLLITYVMCFSISVLIPVDGPRFLHGPAEAPSGPFRGIALTLLKLFSSRGSAFPSSHVAGALAATYCLLRFQRRLGYVAIFLTFGLAFGAVYGGLHYAVDVIAGGVVGALGIAISRILERPARESIAATVTDTTPVKVQVMRARMAEHGARRSRPVRPSKEVAAPPGDVPPLPKPGMGLPKRE